MVGIRSPSSMCFLLVPSALWSFSFLLVFFLINQIVLFYFFFLFISAKSTSYPSLMHLPSTAATGQGSSPLSKAHLSAACVELRLVVEA